jgi:hypothetical protein
MSQQVRFGSSQGNPAQIFANTHDKRHLHSHQRFVQRGDEEFLAAKYNHFLASPGFQGRTSMDFMTSYPAMSKFQASTVDKVNGTVCISI